MCGSSECLQLTERETLVCVTICTSDSPLSFSAIRESAGYHQEILSRILKRLVNHGAIVKVQGKYARKSVNN